MDVSVRKRTKKYLQERVLGVYVVHYIRLMREKVSLLRYSDYECVLRLYERRFGRKPDLANPKTYTEKLNWLKLFYHVEEMPIVSDKFAVRKYLEERGYGYLLNELIGVYDDVNDIDFASLPNKFVAKANHGSSWNVICTDKNQLNLPLSKALLSCWLKENCYVVGREWNYKDMKPRVVVEKFIEATPLTDYKFMCFNGKALYMQINHDMDGQHYVDFYDIDWNRMPFSYGSYMKSDIVLEKPAKFEEMKRIAEDLAKPFPFVRVDFYNPGDTIYFGELTFFPGGGMWPLNPTETKCDELLGEKLTLPEPNYNLELYRKIKG